VIYLPTYSYSFSDFDKNKHVRASLRETDISHKHAREIALAIKGLSMERARNVLDQSIEKKLQFLIEGITMKLPTDLI
jgi:large subunit ribosomal protein L22